MPLAHSSPGGITAGYMRLPDGTCESYHAQWIVDGITDESTIVIAMPIDMYRDANRSWVLPLQFVFSFAWALEM